MEKFGSREKIRPWRGMSAAVTRFLLFAARMRFEGVCHGPQRPAEGNERAMDQGKALPVLVGTFSSNRLQNEPQPRVGRIIPPTGRRRKF
jgi:hypothetical protein